MTKNYERNPIRLNLRQLLCSLGLLLLGASDCFSDSHQIIGNVTLYNEPPTAYELAKMLYPPKTRTIVLNQDNTEQPPGSVALMIKFEYDSVVVQKDSEEYLDALGDMLNFSQLKDKSLQIEGHADATGDERYNLQLSEARAESIKQYLQSVHRIAPERLYTFGYGESKLLDRDRPGAEINRRAEFSPLSSNPD